MLPRQFLLTLLVPFALVGMGTVVFQILEGLDFQEAFYLTVTTLSTVGYGDVVPHTTAGRYFCMFLIVGGVFSFFYAATAIIRGIVSGEVAELMGRRHMERTLAQLHDHIIVCGFGRMGKLVCREFSKAAVPFVVLDESAEALQEAKFPYGMSVVGDATSDESLRHVGIERARGLVAVMKSDADNLFTTMSARLLNPRLFIVARVEDAHSEQKLLRAGANRVVSPYQIGGTRVAQAILRPTVMDFIELATRTEHIDLQLEEARLQPNSPLVGLVLKDSKIRSELRIIIVAIKKPLGHMVFNPDPDTRLEAGDILVAIGHRDQLEHLGCLAGSTSS